MQLQYNTALLPPPTLHSSHAPSISFGVKTLPEMVDKHPSMNANRLESSGVVQVDIEDRHTKEGWWGGEEPRCCPTFLVKFTYASCSCSNVEEIANDQNLNQGYLRKHIGEKIRSPQNLQIRAPPPSPTISARSSLSETICIRGWCQKNIFQFIPFYPQLCGILLDTPS